MVLALVIEKMESKILLNISNLDDIEEYKKLGITNFLFPLKDYSVGYKDFSFDEIKDIKGNIYILTNRLLEDEDIDNFLNMDIPKNVKGFVVEDIGLYYVLKNKGYELINFQNHLNNNYETINIMLNDFDSLVISTDITLEEISIILDKTTKPLILNTFGKPMIMYSRRRLITNYMRYYGRDSKDKLSINENIFHKHFDLVENKYGTAIFNHEFTDYRGVLEKLDDNKIKYYLIDTNFISASDMKKVINNEKIDNTSDGFLYKKTIYKVGDIKW